MKSTKINININKENNHCKPHELELAITEFISRGGTINSTFQKEPETKRHATPDLSESPGETTDEYTRKMEMLKDLITKGAGISALQYSLKMNKDEIKRMAREQGLKITYRRPLCPARKFRNTQPAPATARDDDVVAGHAMHYAALGYTALEIAQTLELSVRQVWELAKNYRFEPRHQREEHEE